MHTSIQQASASGSGLKLKGRQEFKADAKLREEVTEARLRQKGFVSKEWKVRDAIFTLLKRKTGALPEARKISTDTKRGET